MRIFRSSIITRILASLVYAYVRLVYATARWHVEGFDHIRSQNTPKKAMIGAFWHGRLIAMPRITMLDGGGKPEDYSTIISRHGDGEFITRVIDHFGINAVRGSSNRKKHGTTKVRGGGRAIREVMTLLQDNQHVCITPDGPKGPRMHAVSHIADMAARTGVNIVPATFSAKPAIVFNSWDRFMLPLPFARIALIIDAPLAPAPPDDKEALENARKAVENRLNTITNRADDMVGRPTIRPA